MLGIERRHDEQENRKSKEESQWHSARILQAGRLYYLCGGTQWKTFEIKNEVVAFIAGAKAVYNILCAISGN